MNEKRTLVILTGGTIGSEAGEGGMKPGNAGRLRERLLGYLPENVDFLNLLAQDSSNMQPEHWIEIAKTIVHYQHDYTGFVVLHGTDTLTESAAAQAFLLKNACKPVVFTGAQAPLESNFPGDGYRNVVNAVRVAESDLAEVVIVFGDKILRATRTRKLSAIHFDAFASVDTYPLGELGPEGVWFYGDRIHRSNVKMTISIIGTFNTNVLLFKVMPGMSPDMLAWALDAGVEGILFEGYGTGNIPMNGSRSFAPILARAMNANVPVVISTRCPRSIVSDSYEVGAVRLGAISALDMTAEVAYIKLMLALSQSRNLQDIRRFMQTNIAGELGVYAKVTETEKEI